MSSKRKERRRIDPTSLGIPSSSMDPVETIGMEGNFYRGIATRNSKRVWTLRLMGILMGLLFIVSALVALLSGLSNGLWGIVPLFLAMLLLFVGAKMIWANIF